jgi:hypothetical protein
LALDYNSDRGRYGGQIGGSPNTGATQPIFIPATGGTFTFDNGGGGIDIGAFSTSVTASGPILTWTNQAAIAAVNRANGVTVTWTGGTANSFVQVSGTSVGPGTSPVAASFICAAPASAGQFAVPASVLASMPASATGPSNGGPGSSLTVTQVTIGQPMTAPKLDFGFGQASFQFSTAVVYQ